MIPNIHFEADFLRTALLVGLVREQEVIAWADALLHTEPDPYAQLAEVALARPELTSVREALQPLAEPTNPAAVGDALLAFVATDPAATTLSVPDRVRVLSQLRRENVFSLTVSADIKLFEDRCMLATAGVATTEAVSENDLAIWLASVRSSSYYGISFAREDECAPLLAALSRELVRDRRWDSADISAGGRAWVLRAAPTAPRTTLVVDNALWRIAMREFSPLPVGSRVPYSAVPGDAVIVLHEPTAVAMGVVEATDCLATIH